MSQLSENTMITYDGQLTTTGGVTDNYQITYPNYWDYHYHTWYYPPVPENKIELAFKVVSKLLEEKIIEKLTAKKFIELVNKISIIL